MGGCGNGGRKPIAVGRSTTQVGRSRRGIMIGTTATRSRLEDPAVERVPSYGVAEPAGWMTRSRFLASAGSAMFAVMGYQLLGGARQAAAAHGNPPQCCGPSGVCHCCSSGVCCTSGCRNRVGDCPNGGQCWNCCGKCQDGRAFIYSCCDFRESGGPCICARSIGRCSATC
jgi:hypothetical protein